MSERMEILDSPLRIAIGGKDWFLSPLTIADRAAIAAELTSRRVNAITSFNARAMTDPKMHALGDVALGEAVAKVVIAPVLLEDFLQTVDGQCLMLYYSLKHRHGELTLEAVRQLPTGSVLVLTKLMTRLNTMDDASPPDPTPVPETPTPLSGS